MNDIRVLLVDDHCMVRSGLRALLATEAGIVVVGEAGDAKSAYELALALRPAVVVMDIELPDANGIDASRKLLAQVPEARVMVLSALADPTTLDEALSAGIRGYVLKENAPEELIRAIRAVADGKSYLSPEVGTLMVDAYQRLRGPDDGGGRPALSEREIEVLELMADGLRNKEIAARLDIGVKTVETHRHRLMAKLRCASPAELIRCALREGFINA